jgi:hypothetical protein
MIIIVKKGWNWLDKIIAASLNKIQLFNNEIFNNKYITHHNISQHHYISFTDMV